EEPAVIGAPFYVMEHVAGEVITGTMPPALDTPAERARTADELIDGVVELHSVEPAALTLENYGKPTGYLERQLRRFTGLWEHNQTREVPELDEATAWLQAHRPESAAATIVHGDYRLGNTMFAHATPARLVAIFDWELATIGDPLADVGYFTATYAAPGDPETTLFSLNRVTTFEGFPSREELIARYEERSGRSMSDVRWYQTLALWKSAVFLEGS